MTTSVDTPLSPPTPRVVEVIETLFRIPSKAGEIVPFKLNNVQEDFMFHKSQRTDVLKARQFGISSIILAWFLVECMSHFARCVMIAHDSEATRKLLQRGRFMLQNMKGPKPQLSRDSDQELAFPKTGATFFIGTAGTRNFGRGDTITHLHCSEYAFWPDPRTLSSGLFQAVPHKTGVIVRESTANGYGTYHHQQVIKAMKGSSRFRLLFYAWYIFAEYESMTPLVGEYDERELELKAKFNLSDAKLQWRREKIEEDFNGDEMLFCQEYPATIEEAFLVSGGSMFSNVRWEIGNSNWIKAREMSKVLGGSLYLLSTHLNLGSGGGLNLDTSRALPGYHYSFGIDSGGGTGRDYSELQGVCLETLEQVVVFRSNTLAPPLFAKACVVIAKIFNNAFIVPESNSHGLSTISTIRNTEPYKSNPSWIYRQRLPSKASSVNKMLRASTTGFKTTSTSKPYLIGVLQSLLPEITLYDEVTVDQLRGFGEREEGTLGNVEGSNDDAVIALGLASEGILKLRIRYPSMGDEPKPSYPRIEPNKTIVDFEDIFSRMPSPRGEWRKNFRSEAEYGHHLRN